MSSEAGRPRTEVVTKATRRSFTGEYKARILREVEACAGQSGEIGALLRREGLYSSLLDKWRKQAERGSRRDGFGGWAEEIAWAGAERASGGGGGEALQRQVLRAALKALEVLGGHSERSREGVLREARLHAQLGDASSDAAREVAIGRLCHAADAAW